MQKHRLSLEYVSAVIHVRIWNYHGSYLADVPKLHVSREHPLFVRGLLGSIEGSMKLGAN